VQVFSGFALYFFLQIGTGRTGHIGSPFRADRTPYLDSSIHLPLLSGVASELALLRPHHAGVSAA
jgi:hypothetical protein